MNFGGSLTKKVVKISSSWNGRNGRGKLKTRQALHFLVDIFVISGIERNIKMSRVNTPLIYFHGEIARDDWRGVDQSTTWLLYRGKGKRKLNDSLFTQFKV